ncbi:MAG: hypothetical protein JWP61_737 [Friedmanniella sp.]|nr:hypothetical protein [Friedmanniella sp.]
MTDPTTAPTPDAAERDELIALLDKHRALFLVTARGLTEEQARLTPTVSALSIGGLIKHVSATEAGWLDFIERGAPDQGGPDWDNLSASAYEAFANGFRLLPEETLADTITAYEEVAARATRLARTVDLGQVHPLPEAPWFDHESWSNRRVLVHLIAETAQHAGHADIIRETIDGQRTMG